MRILATILLAFWAFVATSAALFAQEWTAAQVSQPAHYALDAQTWHVITPGMTVPNRSWIQTGKRGRLILRRDAEMIQFKPATVAAVSSRIEGGALLTNVKQKTGSLLLDVETRATKHTSVETPFLAAVVKGTRFEVDVTRRGAALRVERGIVETTHLARGERVDVKAGQRVEVARNSSRGLKVRGAGVKAPVVSVAPSVPSVRPAMSVREARRQRAGTAQDVAPADGVKRDTTTESTRADASLGGDGGNMDRSRSNGSDNGNGDRSIDGAGKGTGKDGSSNDGKDAGKGSGTVVGDGTGSGNGKGNGSNNGAGAGSGNDSGSGEGGKSADDGVGKGKDGGTDSDEGAGTGSGNGSENGGKDKGKGAGKGGGKGSDSAGRGSGNGSSSDDGGRGAGKGGKDKGKGAGKGGGKGSGDGGKDKDKGAGGGGKDKGKGSDDNDGNGGGKGSDDDGKGKD